VQFCSKGVTGMIGFSEKRESIRNITALIIDVLISPLKAFYRDGLLIKDVMSISKAYVVRDFWIDVLAIFAVMMPLVIRSVLSNILKVVWFTKMGTIKRINK
jgi:hypothetical protein